MAITEKELAQRLHKQRANARKRYRASREQALQRLEQSPLSTQCLYAAKQEGLKHNLKEQTLNRWFLFTQERKQLRLNQQNLLQEINNRIDIARNYKKTVIEQKQNHISNTTSTKCYQKPTAAEILTQAETRLANIERKIGEARARREYYFFNRLVPSKHIIPEVKYYSRPPIPPSPETTVNSLSVTLSNQQYYPRLFAKSIQSSSTDVRSNQIAKSI